MWRALALGIVTGMRSQLPTALLAWRHARGELPEDATGPGRILDRRGAVTLTALAALGELVGDKLPMAPSRTETGPLLGRIVLGVSAGASIAAAIGGSRILGGVLGAAGAALGSLLGARFRAAATEATNVPDLVWALLEDVAAVTLGLAATRADAPHDA